eukprot:sb/3463120/
MSKLGGKIIAAFATFVAVLTYLAIGAAIFQAIEQDHEIEQREAYDRELSKLLDKVDPVFHDELKAPCHMIEILEANPNSTAQWNFVNSVIFCLTIVTTIGYGAAYPVTDEGRGFCIFFALIGIPLFMACLAVYAQHTANLIRCIMKKLGLTHGLGDAQTERMQQWITMAFCLTVILTFSKLIKNQVNHPIGVSQHNMSSGMMSKLGGKIIAAFATFVAVLTYLAIGAAIFQAIEQDHEIEQREAYDRELSKLLDKVDPVFHDELKAPCHMIEILEANPNSTAQWNFVNSVIFCLTIVTTIGYGAAYPVTDEGRGFCIFFALIGIPLFMACLAVYAQHTANLIRCIMKKLVNSVGTDIRSLAVRTITVRSVQCVIYEVVHRHVHLMFSELIPPPLADNQSHDLNNERSGCNNGSLWLSVLPSSSHFQFTCALWRDGPSSIPSTLPSCLSQPLDSEICILAPAAQTSTSSSSSSLSLGSSLSVSTNQNSLFRSRDWLSANQGPVFPHLSRGPQVGLMATHRESTRTSTSSSSSSLSLGSSLSVSTNQNSLFRSREWLSANQGPVFPHLSRPPPTAPFKIFQILISLPGIKISGELVRLLKPKLTTLVDFSPP